MKKISIVIIINIILMFSFGIVKATNKWDLHFENIKITEGSVKAIQEPNISNNSNTEITFNVDFNSPGEFYEFTVDIVNNGSIDAKLKESNLTNLTQEQERYLSYNVTYIDGTNLKVNDLLKAGTKETIKIRLEFKTDITAEDLPKENTTVTFSLNASYVQAEEDDEDDDSGENEHNKDNENENDNNDKDNNGNAEENKDYSKENDETKNENNVESINESKKTDLIKNIKTGDKIIMYIVILILSVIALIITRKKAKSQNNE